MVIEDKLNDGLVDDLGHDDDGDKDDDSDVPPWQELILRGDGDGVLAVPRVPHDRRGGRRGPEGRVVLVVQVRQHHDHLGGRFSVSANTSFPNGMDVIKIITENMSPGRLAQPQAAKWRKQCFQEDAGR